MKTKILLFFLAITAFCNAQIINFPDANFKAKLLSASASTSVATNQLSTYNASGDYWVPNQSPYYTVIDLNGDGEIEVSEAQLIKGLLLNSANITDLTGIEYFSNLQFLKCGSNQIQSLNFTAPNTLQYLNCDYGQLTSLNLSGLTNLRTLKCSYNQLTSIDTSNLLNLNWLHCLGNNITNLDFSSNNQLTSINCGGNELTTLDTSNLHYLQGLYCSNNHLTSLDVSANPLIGLFASYNALTYLNLKCGNQDWDYLQFDYNPNLQFVCCDDEDFEYVTALLSNYNYTNCHTNTYCSFTPGGDYNTITGTISIDFNNNGCDVNDIHQPNIRVDIMDSSALGANFTNGNGVYNFYVPSYTEYTITPQMENIDYYTLNPPSATITLNGNNLTVNQNFCVVPNGTHNDLEIFLIPLNIARPGFNANYKLVYKNKGTTTQSGTIQLSFDDSVLDFVSSNTPLTSQSTGNLIWDFTNLQPFQTREINVVLNLNSPIETPALNSGDILNYTTSIIGQTDETPNDNLATLNQIVVNSFDPNDKTCLEGTTIAPSMVGEYVHYIIRFENNGTANAQNIVVKDMIDTNKFDINSFLPISAGHNFETRISNTNKVEFIFQNINLPFDDANNDGYIAFKIKTKSNLVLGDSFNNSANIYFDYNFPIITNNYLTTVQNPLGIQENDSINEIIAYPNPVKDNLHFETAKQVLKAEIYDISGRIITVTGVTNNAINLNGLKTGNYIVKMFTDSEILYTQIIKE
jgi:hypothetical protein